MRRILKQLRKGLKIACVSAVLATSWNVGQPAQVSAAIVNFTGTVSPTQNDISHLYLIFGTGYSSITYPLGAVSLGDFLSGQTTAFSVSTTVTDNETMWWYAAGLYGDISSGQYIEGTNGVTLGILASEGDSWESWFYSTEEQEIFSHLLNDNPDQLPEFWWSWSGWEFDLENGLEITDSRILFDFSEASDNGQIYFESEIVPEPITFVLFGSGGVFVLCRRPRKD